MQPTIFKQGDGVILECDGEKWLGEIALASSNGKSLVVTFNGMLHGHLGMMPLAHYSGDTYTSIIDDVEARVMPLPPDWLLQKDIIRDK